MKQHIYIYLCILLFTSACTKSKQNLSQHILLSEGWLVQKADTLIHDGRIISTPSFTPSGWYQTKVPSTIMGVLTNNGLYQDIFVGKNILEVDKTPFEKPWWYRKEFKLSDLDRESCVNLNLDGISYYANIWLNGKLIASKDSVYGAFRRFSFDITPFVKEENILAIEVFKAQAGDPNIGFVDWNPRPADESMGIYREVSINISSHISLKNTSVKTKINKESLDEAWLTIETEVINNSDKAVIGELVGKIENKEFTYPIALTPNEKRIIRLTSKDIDMLHIHNPRLWWCNNIGSPELYSLELRVELGDKISDQNTTKFGIREIDTYLTNEGHKGFILNGKKILIKGAGWTDDIFLRDTPESNEIQVKYVKDMNLNMIRFENIWGNSQNIYDLCDQYGLLALVGWSCQWEWEAYYGKPCDNTYGCIQTQEEIDLIAKSFEDQLLWLRNHPSIIAWFVGSDMLPKKDLEIKYMDILERVDNSRPYIGAAKMTKSEITGSTGMKMAGPYEYVGPNYWYIDTKLGGAFGFNTETGIGAQLPILESIKKMIPNEKLWPINDLWDFHCTTSSTAMNSLDVLTNTINHKYGEAPNLEDYLLKANHLNYDGTRAMFEAFRVNLSKTTGITQWMLNSAWPSLYWQLYDYYLIPTAAYYAVKKANYPTQLIYNYGNNSIYIVNESTSNVEKHKAQIQFYSPTSKLLWQKDLVLSLSTNDSKKIHTISSGFESGFLSLKLFNEGGQLIADNFYALSEQQDEYDWDKTTWVSTPMKSYNDYHFLSSMQTTSIEIDTKHKTDKDKIVLEIKLTNTSTSIAFFTSLLLKQRDGKVIYPVFWSDNYISLLPNETKILTCLIDPELDQKQIDLEIQSWNTPKITKQLTIKQ